MNGSCKHSGPSMLPLLRQLYNLHKSVLGFLLCFPTPVLALLLLLLLAYNGFSTFFILLPLRAKVLPSSTAGKPVGKWIPLPSNPSPRLASSVISAVKKRNSLQDLKTQMPLLQKSHVPLKRSNVSPNRWPIRRPKKQKHKHRRLRSDAQEAGFSARIRDFFAQNASSSSSPPSSSCKIRFFMTWISPLDSFGGRELLSLESLFKTNPDACLVMVSSSMDSISGRQILKPFSENGFRLTAISPDYHQIFRNTHAEAWFNQLENGNVHSGEISLGQNLSNLLRLVLLYKYGGIYIDTDVIVLKDLSGLKNVIGAQSIDQETGNWSRLNNAVLIFDKNHPLLFEFIKEFALTFDGNKWGHNGPYLVSRVVSRSNGELNFTVVKPSAFYPVGWRGIGSLFKGPKDELHSKWIAEKVRHIRSGSFAVHLWNRQSGKMEIEKGSVVDLIRKDCCLFCNRSLTVSASLNYQVNLETT